VSDSGKASDEGGATTCHIAGAVQNVLNAEVDLHALCLPGDLDAVRERRQGAMSPTRSAVLQTIKESSATVRESPSLGNAT